MFRNIIADMCTEVILQLTASYLSPILIAVGLGVIYLAPIFRRSATQLTGKHCLHHFLLTGLARAGKSTIFLKFGKENLSEYDSVHEFQSGRTRVQLIDIPGFYHVRERYFNKHKFKATAIIFVVDSVTAVEKKREITGSLHTALSDRATLRCPFVILCNKQDISGAKSVDYIKDMLQKELQLARYTNIIQTYRVRDDDHLAEHIFIGKRGVDFSFGDLKQEVEFIGASAAKNELNGLKNWISRVCVKYSADLKSAADDN